MRRLRPKAKLLKRRQGANNGRGLFGLTFVVLTGLGIGLLAYDRIDPQGSSVLRSKILMFAVPVLTATDSALEPLRAFATWISEPSNPTTELERLRTENAELKLWRRRAKKLEQKLAELSELANVVSESKLAFVTARVVARSQGPFGTHAVINAGTSQGVTIGDAVVDRTGLVGEVIEVGPSAATLRLITDPKSSVHISVGPEKRRAIVMGSAVGELFVSPMYDDLRDIATNDEVAIDGQSGTLPDGIRVGKIDRWDTDDLRVEPYANLKSLQYVSVFLSKTSRTRKLTHAGEPSYNNANKQPPIPQR